MYNRQKITFHDLNYEKVCQSHKKEPVLFINILEELKLKKLQVPLPINLASSNFCAGCNWKQLGNLPNEKFQNLQSQSKASSIQKQVKFAQLQWANWASSNFLEDAELARVLDIS